MRPDRVPLHPARPALAALLAATLLAGGPALARDGDTTPAGQLARWSEAAGRPGQAAAGQAFFQAKQGGEWSCASCHGARPTGDGRHAVTGKRIAPLAPAANPLAFTDTAKSDKWFRRNCKEVAARECTAQEKADLLAWLVGLQANGSAP